MLVIKTESQNLDWFRIANKYVERQYQPKKDWGDWVLEKVYSDESFEKEFDFICSNL